MIKAKIDDKNCKILLKGIEDNGKNLSRAMKTIGFPSARKEPL